MIPTIKEKDRIIASRLAYHSDSPERYDIIMFSYPDNEKTKFVKRVIGMPGEVVTVSDGEVFITKSNGEIFKAEDSFVNPDEKPYGSSGPFYIPKKGEEIVTDGSYCYAGNGIKVGNTAFLNKYCDKKDGKYTVSENLYFVIGDNINNSMDSRMWTNKYVAEDKILGKVIFKYYPKFEKSFGAFIFLPKIQKIVPFSCFDSSVIMRNTEREQKWFSAAFNSYLFSCLFFSLHIMQHP